MATEMPIPQDFNRFIPPMVEEESTEEDKSIFEMFEQEDDDVVELPDGSAIIRSKDLGPSKEPDFYANMAEDIEQFKLAPLAQKYLDLIEKDREARSERDKQYEEGIRRTGLGKDAPGGAQFQGASKVVHPIMAEACVDFSARAIKELFPPEGPVRTKIVGETTDDKVQIAERKRDFMNWQLTEQIVEFRAEEEQMLTQMPLGGSQYFKIWYDDQQKRPCVEFVPIDNIYLPYAAGSFYTAQRVNIYLPYAAGSFYTAQRVTEVNDITQEMFEIRVDQGLYIDLDLMPPSQSPDQSKAEQANDKIEGRTEQAMNIDGVRRVFHIYTWLELEDDSFSKGERAPYILMIDELNKAVVGLYRNWEYDDNRYVKLDWIIEFPFIPWRGAYAIGMPHLIGGLSAALTGSLRALLDSAHIATAPTMLKLKGAKISGQSTSIEPTQVSEIEGAPGVDDIRKVAMPVPFNQPSPVLYELLGWLTNAAKGVVTTSEEKIADVTSNAPVGTTQALIEQGAAVFSAIHARLHASQRRVLQVLTRINRWYFDEMDKAEMVEDLGIRKEDFEKNSDVMPVSDPHIFAETQRYAQIQTLASRAEKNPDLYNRLAVEKRILKQIKLPDINEVLPDPKEVKEMNPALENVAMTLGKPVGAFPQQDHIAHLMVHCAYAIDPTYGASPLIAKSFTPAFLEHAKQHMTLWYLNQVDGYASAALDRPFNVLKEQQLPHEADKFMAVIAQLVHKDTQPTFQNIQQVIQGAMQVMQQLQPQPPMDPATQAFVQTSMAETQRRAMKDQADVQLNMAKLEQKAQADQAKLQADIVMNTEDNLVNERIKTAELTRDAADLQNEQVRTALDAQRMVQTSLGA